MNENGTPAVPAVPVSGEATAVPLSSRPSVRSRIVAVVRLRAGVVFRVGAASEGDP